VKVKIHTKGVITWYVEEVKRDKYGRAHHGKASKEMAISVKYGGNEWRTVIIESLDCD